MTATKPSREELNDKLERLRWAIEDVNRGIKSMATEGFPEDIPEARRTLQTLQQKLDTIELELKDTSNA